MLLGFSVRLLVRKWGRLYWGVVVGYLGLDVLKCCSSGLVGVEGWSVADFGYPRLALEEAKI